MRADFRVIIAKQLDEQFQRGRGFRMGAANLDPGTDLADSPNCVKPRELRGVLAGDVGQRAGRLRTPIRQGELRFLPHTNVAMGQQAGQFLGRALFHTLGDEFFRLEHERAPVGRRVVDPVNAPFAGHFPALHPVAHINPAIDAEFDVGPEHAPDEMPRRDQFEGSAFGFEGEGVHAAVGAAAAKVHEKEVVFELIGQAGARKESHAGRAGGDVGNGRHQVGRLAFKMRIPKLFRVERSA